MAHLDDAALAHVARLARLALTAEERTRLAADAERILAHFEAVEQALADAEPLEQGALEPRPDEPRAPPRELADALVQAFPRKDGRACIVPKGL